MNLTRQDNPLSDLELRSDQPMTDRAYAYIRDRIISFAAQPGEVLSESTLSRSLDMSRTPVREALRRLQGEGLVTLDIRYGARVAEVSVDEIDHTYRVLEVLEGLSARLAAELRRTEEVTGLEASADRMRSAESAGDLATWAAADGDLHRDILVISRNPALQRQLSSLYPLIERIRHIHLREEPNRDRLSQETDRHVELVAAIRSADATGAERIARDLFARARIENVRLLKTWVAPLRDRF